MIDIGVVENIHNKLINDFGGSKGVRDKALLLSALARPFATFDQQELYPTAIEKSAAVFESIIINHPFTDGNKRTAYFLLRLILLEHNLDIIATEDEKYNMTIAASKGEIRIEEIKVWIKEHLTTRYQ